MAIILKNSVQYGIGNDKTKGQQKSMFVVLWFLFLNMFYKEICIISLF